MSIINPKVNNNDITPLSLTFCPLSLSLSRSRLLFPYYPKSSPCLSLNSKNRSLRSTAMEMPSISSAPRTVEDIFKDYSGRRVGIVRALTTGNLLPPKKIPSFLPIYSSTPDSSPIWFQMWRNSTANAIQVIWVRFVQI